MEEARKKKWASVALIIGAIGFIIIMIYFTVISTDHYGIEKLKLGHFV